MSSEQEQKEGAPEYQSEGASERERSKHSTLRRKRPIPFFAIVASDIWSNRKVCRAGALAEHAPVTYIFALTCNAARGRTGSFPATDIEPWYIARQLGISEEKAAQALRACVDADLIYINLQDAIAHIVGWDEEWKRSELNATERQVRQEYRDRKRREAYGDEDEDEEKRDKTKKKTQKKSSHDDVMTAFRAGSFSIVIDPPVNSHEKKIVRYLLDELSKLTRVSYTYDNPAYQAEIVGRLREGWDWRDLECIMVYLADSEGRDWSSEENPCSKHLENPTIVFSAKTVQSNADPAIRGTWTPNDSFYKHHSWAE